MTTTDIQKEIVEEFSLFDNKNDKYNYIIEMGKSLAPLSADHKTDSNIIKGCQSKVWLHPELEGDKIRFEVDSDALIVRGIVSLLVRVLSEQTLDDIVNTELFFIKEIGLDQMLSMTRSNGSPNGKADEAIRSCLQGKAGASLLKVEATKNCIEEIRNILPPKIP